MYEQNVTRILETLKPTDVVLDIGGWARPFNRADYVVDAEAYETRGYGGACGPAQGGGREFFTRETWIQRDVCDRRPFPFGDKEIDFVICSHTLEDIRDPLWVCAEMVRVAKRGYLEVPSRAAESSRGVEPGQVGWTHHRWLVEIEGRRVSFLMKYHMLHSHWRFSLPASYLKRLPEGRRVQWLFWEDSFDFSERTIHGVENIAAELEEFVRRTHPHPRWRLNLDWCLRAARRLAGRVDGRLRRSAGGHAAPDSPAAATHAREAEEAEANG